MSAFLMIAATAPRKPIPRTTSHSHSLKSKHRRSCSTTTSLSTSGYTSKASERSSIAAGSSAGSSTGSSTTSSRGRKVFDPEKLQYVDYETTISLFERKLLQFNDDVAQAKNISVGEGVCRALNDSMRSGSQGMDDGGPLLNVDNLKRLQYNYFEKFEPNHDFVVGMLRDKPPAYVQVIAADEKRDDVFCQESATGTRGASLYAEAVRAKLAALERRLACSAMHTPEHSASVRDAFHLSSFWDDVYHDIRCESLGENYYMWLPPRQITQRLFIEVMDFALYRVRVVTCALSSADAADLNADERHELMRNNFFYYQKVDAPLMEYFSEYVKTTFLTHIRAYETVPDIENVRELLSVVVACVCDNLKLHFYGYTRAESVTELFHDFIACILNSLVSDFPIQDPSGEQSAQKSAQSSPRKPNANITHVKRASVGSSIVSSSVSTRSSTVSVFDRATKNEATESCSSPESDITSFKYPKDPVPDPEKKKSRGFLRRFRK
ncbi:hypothetical protein JCM33374_g2602 [Metschnikowia sp. JCM 33374]|nr:hypothetical protein JCM33374_g2602 [Metschnikowia sp. JCM 33374]